MVGPKVFLDYDQEELDRAYNQSAYAANQEHVRARSTANSDEARRHIRKAERVAYGSTEIEKLDLYRTDGPAAPVVVFIHGGAWRGGGTRNAASAAEVFVAAGAHYAAIDFILVEEAGGSLFPMVDQVRRAVAWLYRNAKSFGGDPESIHVIGHSSGAHVGGCVLITDWPNDFNLPLDVVKTGLLASGMYDLYPVSLSARSRYVSFTPEMIENLSAQRHIEHLNASLILAYGTLETPEFQRQSRDFAAAVRQSGKPVELIVGEGYNHFEVLETLANPFGFLGRAALNQIGLTFSANDTASKPGNAVRRLAR